MLAHAGQLQFDTLNDGQYAIFEKLRNLCAALISIGPVQVRSLVRNMIKVMNSQGTGLPEIQRKRHITRIADAGLYIHSFPGAQSYTFCAVGSAAESLCALEPVLMRRLRSREARRARRPFLRIMVQLYRYTQF